ncbi:TonB-dependent receptor family protein [Parashewanella tropica]|uniref:TonB-dependent receptor family protein n=1 Tax=Parashewanella tropica TaxID=2547970 RepID=UPI001059FB7B|nr:TonB-dependent receptor [Parashewanella tropica]
MKPTFKLGLVAAAIATSISHSAFAEDKAKSDKYIERVQILGHTDKLRTESGAATLIGEEELEKFKFDDINRILYSVPGVNIREEDGFGLRPNIGFRGVTPERSKKINIMEDGVLIGPAPYSAPAAYYFPMMNKINAVEVFKGPAAIKYGPNTVAGALNLTTRHVPDAKEGLVDVALGSNGYKKAHGYFGDTQGKLGYLVEGVHLQSDGFKKLDGGGDTGFKKNDIQAKFKYDLSSKSYTQLVELKLDYADEVSNETYLGLTDADFAKSPNRRYRASQKDKMDWTHKQFMLSHFIGNDDFDVTTRVYRNDFERSWFKVNGFGGGIKPDRVLADPTGNDTNQRLYQVLTGDKDTQDSSEVIILGDNARTFFSQGVQSELYWYTELFGLDHTFNVGARFHQDQIKRRHTEDGFLMKSGNLVSDGNETKATTSNLEKTDAISVFFVDTVKYNDLSLTFGVRGEFIDSLYQNQAPNKQGDWQKKSTRIWLPSFSGFYELSKQSGILFGIHEGFVPTSPRQEPNIKPESSLNYELGYRFNNGKVEIEAVAFYHDFKRLIETCSFSACGNDSNIQFNSSNAEVRGLELQGKYTLAMTDSIDFPVSVTYTYTHGEFTQGFDSAFNQWGNIKKGDPLPYLPENQLTLNLGLVANDWQANLITRYVGKMHEASGTGVTLSGVETKALTVADFSASYQLHENGSVYLKVDNVFGKQEIVSRRPYGARPSKPRQGFVGYQYQF